MGRHRVGSRAEKTNARRRVVLRHMAISPTTWWSAQDIEAVLELRRQDVHDLLRGMQEDGMIVGAWVLPDFVGKAVRAFQPSGNALKAIAEITRRDHPGDHPERSGSG